MSKITIPENIPTFDLEVFIIPNLPNCYSSNPSDGHSVVGAGDWWSMKSFAMQGDEISRLGIDPQEIKLSTRSMWVNVWLTGLGVDNLSAHGCRNTGLYEFLHGKDNGLRRDDLLPNYLPEEFLRGVKEGDIKETYITKYVGNGCNDFRKEAVCRIRWTFRQAGHRYASHGEFGELFESLIRRARAYRSREFYEQKTKVA